MNIEQCKPSRPEGMEALSPTVPGALFIIGEHSGRFAETLNAASEQSGHSGFRTIAMPSVEGLEEQLKTEMGLRPGERVAVLALDPSRDAAETMSASLHGVGYARSLVVLERDPVAHGIPGIMAHMNLEEVVASLSVFDEGDPMPRVELRATLTELLEPKADVVIPGYPDQAIQKLTAYETSIGVVIWLSGDLAGRGANGFASDVSGQWVIPTIGVATPGDMVSVVRACIKSHRPYVVVDETGQFDTTFNALMQELPGRTEAQTVFFAITHDAGVTKAQHSAILAPDHTITYKQLDASQSTALVRAIASA